MNKSKAMGLVLLLLGAGLALTVGLYAESGLVLAVGFSGVVALFYMGIGLYSRGKTVTGLLRTTDDDDRNRSLYRTTAYVSGLAAAGGLIGFVAVTANQGELLVRLVFGIVFLYNLPLSVVMWRKSRNPDETGHEPGALESKEPEES
ncbi:MAG: hypothetical protein SV377_03540 [Halobacteria archaeon]|nr:hypothetical protein [Halobacteria archaeon]